MADKSVVESVLQSYADKVGQETNNRVVCEIDHDAYHDFGRFEHLACYLVAGRRLAPMLQVDYQPGGDFPAFIRVPTSKDIYWAFSETEYRGHLEAIFSSPEVKEVVDNLTI